jgi:acyl carrier protein
MIDICNLLYSICEDENVYNKDFDLIDSGLLDSFAFIELFSKLEDMDIVIQPTRIDKELLRTPASIEKLVNDTIENNKGI